MTEYNTITEQEWIQKLEDHTDPETGEVCPNKADVFAGHPKKVLVSAYYNNRWYTWELVK